MRSGVRLLAFAQRDTTGEVARLWSSASENKIAESGQAHNGFGLRTAGVSEAHQLGKATRGQSRKRARAKPFAGDDARSNGEYIFCRAAQLHNAHTGRVVRPNGAG